MGPASQTTRITEALLATTVIGSVLAVGSVHPPWIVLFSALSIGLGAFTLWRQGARLRDLPSPAIVLGTLATYSALQALPLPHSWLAAIAPANASVWEGASQLVTGQSPAWSSLSIDPGASLVEALKWWAYAAAFVTAAALGRWGGATSGSRIVFIAASVTALVTLAHAASEATALYGIYEPLQARPPWALAPLLNPNNLAGYLNLGFFCGVGLIVATTDSGPRWLLALVVGTIGAVSIMSGSRGGAVALGIGALLIVPALLLVLRRRKHRIHGTATVAVQIAAALFAGGVFFVLGATEKVWRQLQDETTSKLRLLEQTQPMIADHLWLGVGRGAYETAFPPYREGERSVVFQFAENFAVQWIAEWGIVVGLFALLALPFVLRPSRLRCFDSPTATASIVGLFALFLQNLLDLGLELLPVGLAVATVTGSMWGGVQGRGISRSAPDSVDPDAPADLDDRFFDHRRLTWLTLALPGVLLVGAVLRWDMQPIFTERHRLQAELARARASGPDALRRLRADISTSLLAHPGDPYLPILGGLVAQSLGDNPLPWIGHAIARDPAAGRPHLLLANVLVNRGARSQALLAARMAVERDRTLTGPSSDLVRRLARDNEEIFRFIPEGDSGTRWLVAVAKGLPLANAARNQLAVLHKAVARSPGDPMPRHALALAWLRAATMQPPSNACNGNAATCLTRAAEQVDRLHEIDSTQPELPRLEARLLLAQGNPGAAEDLLRRACEEQVESTDCWRLRLRAAHAAQRPAALAAAEDGLLRAACRNRAACAAAARTAAAVHRSRREWVQAATLSERAARESGSGGDWLATAEAAMQAGRIRQAEHALKQARLADHAPPPDLVRRIEQAQRNSLLRGIRDD